MAKVSGSIVRPRSLRLVVDGLIDMEECLEKAPGTKVDLGTRTGLHPVLRHGIEQSAIKVF